MEPEGLEPGGARSSPRLDRRGAAITAVVAGLVLSALAWWWVPWDWVPGGELVPAEARSLFTAEQIDRAEEFAVTRRALSWSSYGLSLVVALVLGLTPLGGWLVRRVGRRLPWELEVAAGTLAVLLVGRLVTLPFSLAMREQSIDYDLTRQSLAGWFGDQGRSLLVAWLTTSLALVLMVWLGRRSPRHWYAWAGGVAVAFVVLGSFLYPVLIEPLFNRFTSLPPGPLRTAVFELADEEGVALDDVLVADASRRTTTLNAYVSGIGSTRRVVLYDTLLESAPREEIEVIVAHELAHTANQDVLKGTMLGALGGVAGVALLALVLDSRGVRRASRTGGVADPAVVPLVLALVAVGGFLSSPVINSMSRAVEIRADRDSLAATGMEEEFVLMQRRLALRAVADPTPPALSQFWFGSHPTVLQRVGLPESLAKAAE